MSFTGQLNFGYPITSQNIISETITPNRNWTVRINGANYKIPLLTI